MSETWVLNASPIIALAKAGHLQLLERLTPTLLVPAAVAEEILAGPESDPAHQRIGAGWGMRVTPSGIPSVLLEWGLGAGETAVVAVALERPGSTAVLDDASARACARSLGVRVIGTLAVVLRAKRRGLIAAAQPVIDALRAAGFYLDEQIVRSALAAAGE